MAARQAQTSAPPRPRRLLEGAKEISAHLGLTTARSDRRLRTWVAAGTPARKVGGRWVAYTDELDRWWAERMAESG